MRLCWKVFFLYLFPEVALERGGKEVFATQEKKVFITKRENEIFREYIYFKLFFFNECDFLGFITFYERAKN